MSMEQNMKAHYKAHKITMFLVLCAMPQHVRQSWWSQQRPAAQPPGQGSTKATSCLNTDRITNLTTSVWMEIKSLSQAVKQTPIVYCSTMLKLTTMACLALLMIPRKNSTVLFAQSERSTTTNYLYLLVHAKESELKWFLQFFVQVYKCLYVTL